MEGVTITVRVAEFVLLPELLLATNEICAPSSA